ncbi:SMP-30/gluconolactonase/LRE family protein [Limnohabitans sp. Rim8]|uniref:SMP-30/gluconolactonase/LRE family protein n=1 Tax=Limnohabitans sp. Rim8 TaxID=1100718 RepID=UPI0026050D8C|nr:SMP-30/gluconolactonase/LRE family protein [Limnohabitans sp. Rim8]
MAKHRLTGHNARMNPEHVWTAITTAPDGLSESPFWHPQEHRLYWVDIPGRRLARLLIQGQMQSQAPVEYWPMAEEPGCIAPVQGGGLIVALRDGIYQGTAWGGPLQLLAAAPYDTTKMRFNDGKCDAQGRFWAGTLYEPKDQALGQLYMLDAQGLHAMQGGVTTANGLAWAPDGRAAYWSDTAAHRVRAFDVDLASGHFSGERLFHQMTPKPAAWAWGSDAPYAGRPDGAAMDAEGCYWSAQYEGQRLLRLSPTGQIMTEVTTPVPCPTMPCFGGPDLQTLFITTSRQGRSPQELTQYPQAGCVFAMRVAVPGLGVNFYQA